MTLRLFFHSDDLKANVEVLDCTPQENEFAVVLRATLFHPQGGGQPCDTGWIGESLVLRVVQEPDRIIHFVDRPVPLGMTCIRVDEQRRGFNTRMHSAGHLIGHFVQALGWTPIKAHHWPDEGRVQFKPAMPRRSRRAIRSIGIDHGSNTIATLDVTARRRAGNRFGELPAYGCAAPTYVA